MLCKVLVKKWEGSKNEMSRITDLTNGDYFLFQGRNINGILVRDTTKSSFLFTENIMDYREKPSYVEGEGTAASIVTSADATFQSAFVTLNFYVDNVSTASTVATRVNCESISWVMADGATRSWVTYFEGGKKKKRLCNYSLQQVHNYIDSGTATS